MNTSSASPSESTGFFGAYGGQFVPDELKVRLDEVTEAFERHRDNSFFKDGNRFQYAFNSASSVFGIPPNIAA